MKHYILALLLAATMLTGCGKSSDNEYSSGPADNTPATNATPATPSTAPAIPDAAPPAVAASTAQRTISLPHSGPSARLPVVAVSAAPIDSINAQLAKLGSLSVTSVNDQGYPVFQMECNKNAECVNGVGIPMGTLSDIAKEMTTVKQADIATYGYKCTTICVDNQDQVIGVPEVPPTTH